MNIRNQRSSIVAACSLALCAATAAFADVEVGKRFAMTDTNGDGRISSEEHALMAKQLFAERDTDHNGTVTVSEMDAASLAVTFGAKLSDEDKTSTEKIRDLDRNNDDRLTAAEHAATSEEIFAMIDVDHDGFLSKEECEAAKP